MPNNSAGESKLRYKLQNDDSLVGTVNVVKNSMPKCMIVLASLNDKTIHFRR